MPRNPITFLSSTDGKKFGKTFEQESKRIPRMPYMLNSKEVEAPNALAFYNQIVKYSAKPEYCMFTGRFTQPLVAEPRSGRHDKSFCPDWVCLDFDGAAGYTHTTIIEELGTVLPEIKDVSYTLQYSSSSRMFGDPSLRAHLFFLLDSQVHSSQLVSWLYGLNLRTNLRRMIGLTNSLNGLHWPLDPVLGQNSRIIFITPPQFILGTHDPHPDDSDDPRIQFIQKENDFLPSNLVEESQPLPVLNADKLKVFNKLRDEKGLKRRTQANSFSPHVKNPDPATVTGEKFDGDFVRLNLNGGDSWGYFYNKDKHDVLFNFKDEPTYPLDKIVPDYYNEHYGEDAEPVDVSPNTTETADALMRFPFRDKITYKCHWVEVDYRSNAIRAAENNGVVPATRFTMSDPLGDAQAKVLLHKLNHPNKKPQDLPEYEVQWDPNPLCNGTHLDVVRGIVNTYVPTEIVAAKDKNPKVPPHIETLLRHVLNNPKGVRDIEYNKFLHWLAWVVVKRRKTRVAWVIYGVPSTGKGLLINTIIAPLVHPTNVNPITNERLREKFTDEIESTMVVNVDEANALDYPAGVEDKLKAWITEEYISTRSFGKRAGKRIHHANFIFTTNRPLPVRCQPRDRRYNVVDYQTNRLETAVNMPMTQFNQALQAELPQFMQYLHSLKPSKDDVSTALNNPAKIALSRAGKTTTEIFLEEFKLGETIMLDTAYKEIETLGMAEYVSVTGQQTNQLHRVAVQVERFVTFYDEFIAPGKSFVMTPAQLNTCLVTLTGNPPKNTQKMGHVLAPHALSLGGHVCSIRKKTEQGLLFTPTDED